MRILKRYKDEGEEWKETTEDECVGHTEGNGYWKTGTVLDMLRQGLTVQTPWAEYRAEDGAK